jgi:hypothetical protein
MRLKLSPFLTFTMKKPVSSEAVSSAPLEAESAGSLFPVSRISPSPAGCACKKLLSAPRFSLFSGAGWELDSNSASPPGGEIVFSAVASSSIFLTAGASPKIVPLDPCLESEAADSAGGCRPPGEAFSPTRECGLSGTFASKADVWALFGGFIHFLPGAMSENPYAVLRNVAGPIFERPDSQQQNDGSRRQDPANVKAELVRVR